MKKDLSVHFNKLIQRIRDARQYRDLGQHGSCLDALQECNKLLEKIAQETRKELN